MPRQVARREPQATGAAADLLDARPRHGMRHDVNAHRRIRDFIEMIHDARDRFIDDAFHVGHLELEGAAVLFLLVLPFALAPPPLAFELGPRFARTT